MIGFGLLEIRNFGVIETADLDLKDQGLVLVRGFNRDTDAADSNGSGKTTLLNALSWVLFGEIVGMSRPAEEVIRKGAGHAEVRLTFTDGEHEYGVKRRRTAKTGKLTLTTDGGATSERRQVDTEARICEILGLDWHAFRNTVLFGQNDVHRFADEETTDADRKRVLKRILRLERIDGALAKVRGELKKLRGERTETDAVVRTTQAVHRTKSAEFDQAEVMAARWGRDQDSAVDKMVSTIEIHDVEGIGDRSKADRIERLGGLKVQLDVRLEKRDRLCDVAHSVSDQLQEARARRRETHAARKPAHDRLEERKADVSVLADGVCPTCRTSLDDSETAREHRDELVRRVEEAGVRVHEVDTVDADAALEIERLKRESEEAWTTAKAEDRWIGESDRVAALLKSAKDAAARVAVADARHSELVVRLEDLRAETNPHDESVARLRRGVKEAAGAVTEAEAALTAVNAREPPLKFWEQAFSDRGLPSLALDSVVPFITEAANRYLGFLADGDIEVEIVTQTDLKGGGTREAIDFHLTIEGHRDVRPSGGQRKKLSIAVDLALMDLVATREGARIDLVLLDEVLDGLDAEGKARVVVLLRHLREFRSSVLVISHDPSIAEHFERVVTVVKENGKATLVAS